MDQHHQVLHKPAVIETRREYVKIYKQPRLTPLAAAWKQAKKTIYDEKPQDIVKCIFIFQNNFHLNCLSIQQWSQTFLPSGVGRSWLSECHHHCNRFKKQIITIAVLLISIGCISGQQRKDRRYHCCLHALQQNISRVSSAIQHTKGDTDFI